MSISDRKHPKYDVKPTDESDVHVIIEPEYLHRVFYRVTRDKVGTKP
jgi:hypothetical protein